MAKTKIKPSVDVLREAIIDQCAKEVPTNWCDSLLTGPNKVIHKAPAREIEALLRGIQDRIRNLKNIPQ